MTPRRTTPRLIFPVWAGDRLARLYGKGPDAAARVGESWENEGRDVLVKLIDVRNRLSVQVHPGDDDARRLEGLPHGKSERWVVIEADEGARVALGLLREMTVEELAERALSGEIEGDLAWRPVHTGDAIDVPAGTIHAIGGGVLLYEAQQPCDVTYRLYDWGRGRALHLEKAMQVARRGPWEARPAPFRVEQVAMGRRTVRGEEALTVLRGELIVSGERVDAGQTVVLGEGIWEIGGDGEALAAGA